MVRNVNVNINVNNDLCFTLSCELVQWPTIFKSQALGIFYRAHARAVEGVVGEGKSFSWGGAQTKGEVHKCKLTNKIFLHSDLLTSLSSSRTPLFYTIIKLALRTNGIKIWRAINQSNRIMHMFDLSWTLPKYLRTFWHENEFLIIGLRDQSDYSICHFMVRIFIRSVQLGWKHLYFE